MLSFAFSRAASTSSAVALLAVLDGVESARRAIFTCVIGKITAATLLLPWQRAMRRGAILRRLIFSRARRPEFARARDSGGVHAREIGGDEEDHSQEAGEGRTRALREDASGRR